MSLFELVKFNSLGDVRGELVSMENNKEIPFEIKRVYLLMKSNPNLKRGFHAHLKLRQVLVCISGSCKITLDNGKNRETRVLNNYLEGIKVDHFLWREIFDFSNDCILMVLASELYDETDYIRDYNEFKRIINGSNS